MKLLLRVVGIGFLGVLALAACGGERPESAKDSAYSADTTATLAQVGPADDPTSLDCLISSEGIGPIRLGMTLDQALQAFPQATLERSSDGEGAALVSVVYRDSALMSLHAGEPSADAPIDGTGRISFMETFSALCHTADGLRPGSLVTEAEGALGPVASITLSEIESRQFIEFERQPAGMILRLDYSGEFVRGERETMRYRPGARLLSIAVVRPR